MENLIISGAGNSSGGEYNKVSLSGANTINSDTKCVSFKCSGSSKVLGKLDCNEFSAAGATKIQGEVNCEDGFKCSGSTIVGGVCANELHISGAFASNASVAAKILAKTSGSVKITGNFTGEVIDASGKMSVKGDINAEKFTFEMTENSDSDAETIGGSEIKISRKEQSEGSLGKFVKSIFNLADGNKSVFTVDEIEGDTIELEGVHANVVRGNDINIGADCKIKRVEYTGKVTYSDSAEIGELTEI